MNYENLIYTKDGFVATITINRPKVLNALNVATVQELDKAVREANNDSEVRAIILTGAGGKSFVAGADIGELAKLNPMEAKAFATYGQHVMNHIAGLDKPVIAAVNGFALGGGCELAMACHIRYAHSSARFGQPEVNLGLIPGYGGTQRLMRIVGYGNAVELLANGEMINSKRALDIGLVNAVFDAWKTNDAGEPELDDKGRKQADMDGFMEAVQKKVASITNKAPIAVRFAIEAARRGAGMTLTEGQKVEADLFGMVCTTSDFKEGTTAFLEKRKAEFKGE
ncbi:enoyl-CoA hydratase/isomerase family protein [bacterium]|nr:enoyl-CoA hydratase/isomerase family protein [bacterium]